ncbi:MAG TPA: RNA methyltransferase [Myxococcota bacterium]
MSRFAVALVHYPCLDKHGEIFTTSITNLDVHDIARASTTYGVDAFYVVTPVTAQRDMAHAIAGYWESSAGQKRNADRTVAMKLVHVVASVDDAVASESALVGHKPLVVVTSAKEQGAVPCATLRARLAEESALVLFGTGHGLAPSIVDAADLVLEPLRGRPSVNAGYNHLSVRSAVAIFLDRLLA